MQLYTEPLTIEQKAAIKALADDMECGAKLHPKATGTLFHLAPLGVGNSLQVSTCALGAALACRKQREDEPIPITVQWRNEFPWMGDNTESVLDLYGVEDRYPDCEQVIDLPDGNEYGISTLNPFSEIIWTLNDQFDASREFIATWLHTLE